jgi:hypothetical protein
VIPIYPKQARYRGKAGQPNPLFLDAELFNKLVPTPYEEASSTHTGPLLSDF